jgi:hypothetical protein
MPPASIIEGDLSIGVRVPGRDFECLAVGRPCTYQMEGSAEAENVEYAGSNYCGTVSGKPVCWPSTYGERRALVGSLSGATRVFLASFGWECDQVGRRLLCRNARSSHWTEFPWAVREVHTNTYYGCLLGTDSSVVCWNRAPVDEPYSRHSEKLLLDGWPLERIPRDRPFSTIGVSESLFACGLDDLGVACWGGQPDDVASATVRIPGAEKVQKLAVGSQYACGLRVDIHDGGVNRSHARGTRG